MVHKPHPDLGSIVLIAVALSSVSFHAAAQLLDDPSLASEQVSSGAVAIDRDQLLRLATAEAPTLELSLTAAVSVHARSRTVSWRSPEQWTITGKLGADGEGWFVVACDDEAIAGAFWTVHHGFFSMRIAPGTDNPIITAIDTEGLADCICEPDHSIMNPAAARPANAPASSGDNGLNNPAASCEHTIDVLVAYTPAARNAVGGDAVMQAFAQACAASTNIVMENSNSLVRVRLVHAAAVSYVESSNLSLDLLRMQTPLDGQLDEVHGLRQLFGADLVVLLVESNANGCGAAYIMTTPSESFAPFGYSVVQQNCALSNFTFAHELAHNFGCQHDHSDPSPGAFPYSHGLRFTGVSGQTWRTVMAGSPGTRLPFFSNPTINFDGIPIGISEDTPELGPPADNARSLNNTAHVVSAFVDGLLIDCNRNGIDDACEIAGGESLDVNENGVPDECDALPCRSIDMTKFAPADAQSFDRVGESISMTDQHLVVGSRFNDRFGSEAGAAYVFNLDQPGAPVALHPTDAAPFQWFGASVAISQDGTRVLVGAPRDGFEISDVGAAYIFRRDGDDWVQEAKLPNPDPEQQDFFGLSVAWAGARDGDLSAVIGALFDREAASSAGAIYVVPQTEIGWGPPVKLLAADAASGDQMGFSVSGSTDGSFVIAGAPLADAGAANVGAAYIFRKQGDPPGWVQQEKLMASDSNAESRFGSSVAIDEDRALIGSPRDGQFGDRAGAAYLFVRVFGSQGDSWEQEIKLVAADAGPQERFGTSVALREDIALVGAILDSTAGSPCGSAFAFQRHGQSWTQHARIAPHDGAPYDNFGGSVAIAPGLQRAAAGALFDDHQGVIDVGTVSVFSLIPVAADCNGNGVDDQCDIDNNTSADENRNGVPDECDPSTCPSDISGGDDRVGVPDLLMVINQWGPCDATCPLLACVADLTGDCEVGVADLMYIIRDWGDCPVE